MGGDRRGGIDPAPAVTYLGIGGRESPQSRCYCERSAAIWGVGGNEIATARPSRASR